MNWFTSTYIAKKSDAEKQALFDQDGGCDHAQANISVAAWYLCERDSFGIVGSNVACDCCKKQYEEEEGNELHTCKDCKQEKPLKDGILWKWYDFYEAQGDVAPFICNCCKKLPTHLARVEADRRAYDEEFGDDQHNDDNDQPEDQDCGVCHNLDCHDPKCVDPTHYDNSPSHDHDHDQDNDPAQHYDDVKPAAQPEAPKLITGVAAWPFPTRR